MYWITSLRQVGWIQDLARAAAIIPICIKCLDAAYLAFTPHNPIAMTGCLLIGMAVEMALFCELTGVDLYPIARLVMGAGSLYTANIFSIPAWVLLLSQCFSTLTNHPSQNRLFLVSWYATTCIMFCSIHQDFQTEQFDQLYAKILFILCYFSMAIHPQPAVYMSIFSCFGFADWITSYGNVFPIHVMMLHTA